MSWQDNVALLLSTTDKADRQKVIDAINKKIALSGGGDNLKNEDRKRKDVSGKRFGLLTAIRYDHSDKLNQSCWLCKCDCGNETMVRYSNLIKGHTKSCGCLRKNHDIQDLTGMVFGKLTVVNRVENSQHRHVKWLCSCECGNNTCVTSAALTTGKTQSCGCLRPGLSKQYPRLYRIWQSMKSRCYYEKNQHYLSYGGRGINICDEWRNSFNSFREWAISNNYNEALSIDRIDVNKGYYPENCRWATMKEQGANRRNTSYITINGITKPLAKWSTDLNMSIYMLRKKYAIKKPYLLEQIEHPEV